MSKSSDFKGLNIQFTTFLQHLLIKSLDRKKESKNGHDTYCRLSATLTYNWEPYQANKEAAKKERQNARWKEDGHVTTRGD